MTAAERALRFDSEPARAAVAALAETLGISAELVRSRIAGWSATAELPAPDKSWVKTSRPRADQKVAKAVARLQRMEAQLRAIVRDELTHHPSSITNVTNVSGEAGPRSGVEDPAPDADHLVRRIELIAAALPGKFTLAYCPSMVDRCVVVAEVLEAMAAIDEAGLS